MERAWRRHLLVHSLKQHTPCRTFHPVIPGHFSSSNKEFFHREADKLSDEILDAIVEAGGPIVDQLAPSPATGTDRPSDLHTLLVPDEFVFNFQTSDSRTKLIGNEGDHVVAISPSTHLATCSSSTSTGTLTSQDSPPRIFVCSKASFAMAESRLWGLRGKKCALRQEIAKVRKRRNGSSTVFGRSLPLHMLHKICVTWGNGKASNVLIYRDNNDAWVIDFGGGWTHGWVTRELSRTVEGDSSLYKIYLRVLG
ncbi:hypothetical protein BN1723_011210, partial [Verticillium longisporum]